MKYSVIKLNYADSNLNVRRTINYLYSQIKDNLTVKKEGKKKVYELSEFPIEFATQKEVKEKSILNNDFLTLENIQASVYYLNSCFHMYFALKSDIDLISGDTEKDTFNKWIFYAIPSTEIEETEYIDPLKKFLARSNSSEGSEGSNSSEGSSTSENTEGSEGSNSSEGSGSSEGSEGSNTSNSSGSSEGSGNTTEVNNHNTTEALMSITDSIETVMCHHFGEYFNTLKVDDARWTDFEKDIMKLIENKWNDKVLGYTD